MCVFFFEEDIKDLIVGQQRAKLALIDRMITSLEEGHAEDEEDETSIGDGGIPTSDGERLHHVTCYMMKSLTV